jgi:formylglycine-generating enzyme required for sulfatase activity
MAESNHPTLEALESQAADLRKTLDNLAEMDRKGLPVAEAIAQAQEQLTAINGQIASLQRDETTPSRIFSQPQQQVDHQTNIAGDMRGPALSGKFGGPAAAGGGDAVDLRGSQGAMYKPTIQVTPEPGASPESLHKAYLNRLVSQIYRLPLTGVDPKVATDEGSRELELAAVYTALMTQRPDSEGDLRYMRAERRMEDTPRHLSALEVLNQEPRLALLGDPGSGKSTFVNFVGLCLAGGDLGYTAVNLTMLTAPLPQDEVEDPFSEDEKAPQPQPWNHGFLLPVRIVLRDFAARGLPDPGQPADGGTLWTFIETELGETLKEYGPHLKKRLQEEGGLILLDGLDEVPDADQRREQVKQAVQGFAADFPCCRFLITSRTYAYQRQDWKLEGFAEAVLSPFTPAQIERFIERWYTHVAVVRHLDVDDAHGQAVLLKDAIERSARLAELATRPLLLTLMASLHAWRGGNLPEKREQLYADAVDLLLDQWERPKVVRDAEGRPIVRQDSLTDWLRVDRSVVRSELNRLAFEGHRDQPKLVGTADIAEEQLVVALMKVARSSNPDVNPVRLEDHLRDRAGLLAARGAGVYTFPHRTFQEYLAACHLTDFGFPDDAAELLATDPQRWREAVLLAGAKASRGTASAAWNLAEALCHAQPPNKTRKKMPEPECWGALLAAQTLLENERERLEQVAERNRPKLERIRRWLLAIIQRGWLPPVDRALAGEALSVFGDTRDFDELVPIAAGSFWMGDNEDENARPRHEVSLPAFKIGRYPVTNAQYRRFVEDTQIEWDSQDGRRPEKTNNPAVAMTWHDARAHCTWLTDIWRNEGKINAKEEVRLPSEAEWEKAARGTDGRVFPWGDKWDESRCNMSESGIGRTCAVGMYPNGASPFGVLDMAGNVWEWTGSLWGKRYGEPDYKYPYKPGGRRENLEAGDDVLRVLRGGSWLNNQYCARGAARLRLNPYSRLYPSGFRIVVSPISAL